MNEQNESQGRIEVSPTAVASLAREAVLRSYGVVGTVPPNLAAGIANILSRDSQQGVIVQVRDHEIIIDLYIVVEYGTRIASVARSAMNLVKYTVEKALGVPVTEVNVHIADVHISDPD